MLRIAICVRDKKQQTELLDFIAHDTEIDDDCITECFQCEDRIKTRLENYDFNFDLLFLEISTSGREGLSLASCLREQKADTDIIFLAESLDFITEGFHLKAFTYLVKPLTYERFCYEMSQYLRERREYQNEYLSVLVQGKERMLSLNTIIYFISDARKIGAVSNYARDPEWFYGKMDELEERLSSYGFLRCHQSYLINIHKICGMTSEQIQTKRGTFPISRRYRTEVKEKWEKYKKFHNIQKTGELTKNTGALAASASQGMAEAVDKDFETDGMTNSATVAVTKSFARGVEKYGLVMGIRGMQKNEMFRLYQGEEIIIGRDRMQSQIVVKNSTISRKHCGIRFDEKEQCYYVCDYSSNGTFIGNWTKLAKGEWVKVGRETLVQLTNDECSFLLL